jgi:DNA-binding transcriptional regulator YhcF (GntR family)
MALVLEETVETLATVGKLAMALILAQETVAATVTEMEQAQVLEKVMGTEMAMEMATEMAMVLVMVVV